MHLIMKYYFSKHDEYYCALYQTTWVYMDSPSGWKILSEISTLLVHNWWHKMTYTRNLCVHTCFTKLPTVK